MRLIYTTTCDGRALGKPAVSMDVLRKWGTFAICHFLQWDNKRKMLEHLVDKGSC